VSYTLCSNVFNKPGFFYYANPRFLNREHLREELSTPAPSEQQEHSKVSLRRAVDTVYGVEWRVFEPTIRVWRSGTTGKQPANLAVEAAEESLTILPDYTPTVRPPTKRC
jgi:hypothetical protein